jgi:hypothetical protein
MIESNENFFSISVDKILNENKAKKWTLSLYLSLFSFHATYLR